MEDVLCNNIDKCFLNQNYGILQSSTIHGIIEKSDKDKINSDILYFHYFVFTNFCISYSSESKRYFDYLKIDINYIKSLIDEKRRLENIVDNLNREKEEAVNKLKIEKEEIINNLNREKEQFNVDKEKLNEKCQKLKEENDQTQLCDDYQILQMLLNRKDQQISKLGFLLLFLLKEKLQSKISINSCEYIFIPTNETDDLQNIINMPKIEKYYEEIDLIKIEPTFTSIENSFFNGYLSLTKIVIPSSVTCIGDNAFENCSKLVEIIIDDQYNSKITSIDERAFSGCSLMTKF